MGRSRNGGTTPSPVDNTALDALLAVLICERCPLRLKCLETALNPLPEITIGELEYTKPSYRLRASHTENKHVSRVWGIWGASTMREHGRAIMKTDSPEAAAELLEAELPQRIAKRVRAWKKTQRAFKHFVPHRTAIASEEEGFVSYERDVESGRTLLQTASRAELESSGAYWALAELTYRVTERE
jgi:hypothetical protein